MGARSGCDWHFLLEGTEPQNKSDQNDPKMSILSHFPANFRESLLGAKYLAQFFVLKLLGHCQDIPSKSRDVPSKKLNFHGFEAHADSFGPHPFTWKTPTSPEKSDSKIWVYALFSCLNF